MTKIRIFGLASGKGVTRDIAPGIHTWHQYNERPEIDRKDWLHIFTIDEIEEHSCTNVVFRGHTYKTATASDRSDRLFKIEGSGRHSGYLVHKNQLFPTGNSAPGKWVKAEIIGDNRIHPKKQLIRPVDDHGYEYGAICYVFPCGNEANANIVTTAPIGYSLAAYILLINNICPIEHPEWNDIVELSKDLINKAWG